MNFVQKLTLATPSALALPHFAAAAEPMWVHGSWVNVRATAEAESEVIEHVTTNTNRTRNIRRRVPSGLRLRQRHFLLPENISNTRYFRKSERSVNLNGEWYPFDIGSPIVCGGY
ncbi:hypothetical protein AGMMS49545_11530 [Betaproteobacteria bacterium]|nr:hypothetical protein AGMMS49545_11530 [Betaproteobacteria bacterium]